MVLVLRNWCSGKHILDAITILQYKANVEQTKLNCPAYVFFFGRVALIGWFVTFSRVVVTVTTFLVSANLVYFLWGILVNWKDAKKWLFAVSDPLPLPPTESPPQSKWVTFTAHVLAWALFVVIIELTLRWNNTTGVYTLESDGQLISFIVGLVEFLGVLYSISFKSLEIGSSGWAC